MDDPRKVREFEAVVRSERSGLSRRQFLRRGLALGLSLPAASGVIASVLGPPAYAMPKPGLRRAQKGGQGTLVVGQNGDPKSFNPDNQIDDFNFQFAFNIFSTLVCLSQTYDVIPDLAKSWEVSEDGKQITFLLNEGVSWHDGEPVTAADVKWTYEKIVATEGAPGRDNLSALDHIETPDDYTAVFVLKNPSSPFLGFLAWYGTFVLPKHIYDGTDWMTNEANQNPVGCGPFKFVEYVAGDHVTLEANLDYFGEGPYMDRVVTRIIPDPATMEQALLNEEVDADPWGSLSFDSIPNFEADGRFTVIRKEFPSVYYLTFNFNREITGNVKVRQAIGMAIDRAVIIERGLAGFGNPVNTYYTPVIAWANNPDATAPEYDPEAAKALLDEAGYPVGDDGYRFKLVFPYFSATDQWRNIAQVVQAQLRDIGIDVELAEMEIAAWEQRLREQDDFDLSLLDGFFGPGPGNLKNRYGTGGGINLWHYSNAEVDRLLDEAAQSADQAAATEMYHQIQALLAQDIASIPLSSWVGSIVYRKELSGFPVPGDPVGEILGFYNYARVQRTA